MIASLAPVIILGLLAVGVLIVIVQGAKLRGARKRLGAQGFQVSAMHGAMGGSFVAVDSSSRRFAIKATRDRGPVVESTYPIRAVQSVTRSGDDGSELCIVVMPKMGTLHEYALTMNDRHVATSVIEALQQSGAGADDGWGVAYIDNDDA